MPACSTGEEAYSIAMIINELQEKKNKKIPVQIFATDLSEEAIKKGLVVKAPKRKWTKDAAKAAAKA